MNYNQFKNLSCYEEFEIRCALTGISKINILKKISHQIDSYYFFVSKDGIFNWFDLEGNHIEDPGVLTTIIHNYIPRDITKCIIPNSVMHIGKDAFSHCYSLKEITIPNSVKTIGYYAFAHCTSLDSINMQNGVKYISEGAFVHCNSLKEITIPDSVTSIEFCTFFNCKSLTSINMSNSITSISNCAFQGCYLLTSITIPGSVTSIDDCAFLYCDSLKEVIFKGKTLDEVKQMNHYPFGIEGESIIKCEV